MKRAACGAVDHERPTIGGGLIHILIVIAIIVLVYNLAAPRHVIPDHGTTSGDPVAHTLSMTIAAAPKQRVS